MTKLPYGRLVRHAYLDVIGNLPGLVRISLPWILLIWALLMLGQGGSVLATAAADIVLPLAVAAIAVLWHRHILLGEPLAAWMAPINRQVARYFVLTVLITLLLSLAPLLTMLLVGGIGGAAGDAAPAVGPGFILVPLVLLACLYMALRLQLAFPATAIDDRAMTLARSWALTRGNGWRLFLGFLIITTPVAVITVGLMLVLDGAAESTGSVALRALSSLAVVANAWLQAPLIASFLSYAYTFFRQEAEAMGGGPPANAARGWP